MKKLFTLIVLSLFLLNVSSCAVIGGIFKAGTIVGVFTVVIAIAVAIWIISMFRGKLK